MALLPKVHRYSINKLINCILHKSSNDNKNKFQFKVFEEYFGKEGHNASTIIVEDDYYSESYVSDLSLYYSYSNSNFTKYCKRIHLLKGKFRNRDTFINEICNLDNIEIINDYIGYIVVKPLPETEIGATLLKTYEGDIKRHFNSIREYNLNLFGRKIKLNTLIFQEQDKNVAACATCAVWFASHYYINKTNSPKLSLYEITQLAGSSNKGVNRIFPSASLDEYQIANAIRKLGLDFEPVNKLNNISFVKAYLYSYNKGGVPILLGVYLPFLGYHLVTVVGYNIDNSILDLEVDDSKYIKLRSSLLTKIYAHDEHTGPYARFNIIEDSGSVLDYYKKKFAKNSKYEVEEKKIKKSNFFLKLNWNFENNVECSYGIVKDIFPIIPPIIRISYKKIFNIIKGNSISDFIEYISEKKISTDNIFWDIYLIESNNFKESLLTSSVYNINIRNKLLSKSLPKYIWVARGYFNMKPYLEFIFDATDLQTNLLGRVVVIFDFDFELRDGLEGNQTLTKKVNEYSKSEQNIVA